LLGIQQETASYYEPSSPEQSDDSDTDMIYPDRVIEVKSEIKSQPSEVMIDVKKEKSETEKSHLA